MYIFGTSVGSENENKFLMNIAIIGYGQIGEIEKISISRNHKIGKIIDQNTTDKNIEDCDVAILFTTPKSAVDNIKLCR